MRTLNDDTPDSTADLHRTLGLDEPAHGHRRRRAWLSGAVLLALAGLTVAYLIAGDDEGVRSGRARHRPATSPSSSPPPAS
jgi:hypothetical protein